MKYILVKWVHDFMDEPITLFSELDEENNEVRKIELYKDGKIGYATSGLEVGGTELGIYSIPDVKEIVSDPQFKLKEISKEEFERVWDRKIRG